MFLNISKYNYYRLSQNLPPKKFILVSDLTENIYLIYESVSYFNAAKSLSEGSYPVLNPNLNIKANPFISYLIETPNASKGDFLDF